MSKKPTAAQAKVLDAARRRVLVRSNGTGMRLYAAYCTDGTAVRQNVVDACVSADWLEWADDPDRLIRGRWVLTAAGQLAAEGQSGARA